MTARWRTRRLRVLGGTGRINTTAAEATGAPVDDASWYAALLAAPQRVIKGGEDHRVASAAHDGGEWIIKCWRLPIGRRVIGGALRATPAWREWRGARRVHAIGIEAVTPLALLHRPRMVEAGNSGSWTQILISPRVPGKPLSEYLRDNLGGPADRRALFEAIGRQIGAMTRAGWVNRDHKSANIIVTPEGRPVLIDCGDLRRRRRFGGSDRQIERLFALLRETTTRYGTVAPDDFAACIAAARKVDPTIPAVDG